MNNKVRTATFHQFRNSSNCPEFTSLVKENPLIQTLTILVSFSLLSSTVFAAKGSIYCKIDGQAVNAIVEDEGTPCAAALWNGNACFTGDRQTVINLINNGEVILSDEEWISDAHFMGRHEIAYKVNDGPNEQTWREGLVRCSSDFFRK